MDEWKEGRMDGRDHPQRADRRPREGESVGRGAGTSRGDVVVPDRAGRDHPQLDDQCLR